MPRNWDQHYSDPANVDRAPAPLLVQVAGMLPPGHALDLACGAGSNALHLAALGWRVTAVDYSAVALGLLRQKAAGLAIETARADLERGEFAIARGSYDLICDFLYLQRNLFPAIREGLKPGGVFVGALRLDGSFRMNPGELRAEFAGWKISYYSETQLAQIIARKA